MRAELVMVGTELLLGETVDTNATYLAQQLAELGIDLYNKSTVGDNWFRLMRVLSSSLSQADLVITSGGLGPTMDDITREAAAAVFNRPLELDPDIEKNLRQFFARRNVPMTENNLKQAYIPKGAKIIENRWGTAPAFMLEGDGKTLICLPGVPRELKGMFANTVRPLLAQKCGQNQVLFSRTLHFAGIGESALEDRVADILTEQTNPTIAPYASFGEVKLRITAKANDQQTAEKLIKPVEQQIRKRTEQWLFGTDSETLEGVIADKLIASKQTVTTAESCTGGLVAHRLTNIPGSSNYFLRGFITYSNEAKTADLGVPAEVIAKHGAVSEQTVRLMAEGARAKAGTTWALALSGIAGPSGGTPEKPVGLVYIGLAGKGHTKVEVHQFSGTREDIKFRASQAALNLLRIHL